jgi:hypothetical protein
MRNNRVYRRLLTGYLHFLFFYFSQAGKSSSNYTQVFTIFLLRKIQGTKCDRHEVSWHARKLQDNIGGYFFAKNFRKEK